MSARSLAWLREKCEAQSGVPARETGSWRTPKAVGCVELVDAIEQRSVISGLGTTVEVRVTVCVACWTVTGVGQQCRLHKHTLPVS